MKGKKNFQIPMDVIEECLKECLDDSRKEKVKDKTTYVSDR